LFQIDLDRIIVIYVTQGFLAIFFAVLTYQILKRRRKRLNLIFSSFFISIAIGAIFNMIYAPIPIQLELVIKVLYFCSIFFIFFGPVFILIVNFIILESTIIFSVKRQNRYIFLYSFLIFFGMLILMLIPDPDMIIGVEIESDGRPKWSLGFFIYTISILTIFTVIPIIRTSLKIYSNLETKALRKKWFYYFIGSLGVFSWAYLLFITNLIANDILRIILSYYGISVILWVLLMYYGIGFKLKQ
jgi:hypothetical protein